MLPGHATSGADKGSQRLKLETTLHPSTGGGTAVGHVPRGTVLSPERGRKCRHEQQRGRKTEARHEDHHEIPPDEIRRRENSGDGRQSRGTEGHEGRAQRGA